MHYKAAVIGAGPGGLAAVFGLLDAGLQAEELVWMDQSFSGGRLNGMYREIPSNTKIGLFLSAFHSSRTCTAIIDATRTGARAGESPNCRKGKSLIEEMEDRDPDQTCQLSLVGDAVMVLLDGLRRMGVKTEQCVVEGVEHSSGKWTVHTSSGQSVTVNRLVFATGSHPIVPQPSIHERFNPDLKVLDLDQCMMRSKLEHLLSSHSHSSSGGPGITVGVIGNSHSGILVCRNLYGHALGLPNYQDDADPSVHASSSTGSRANGNRRGALRHRIKIINFYRRPIKYAIYREDGIVNDNTGLKGTTSDWAKEVMEPKRHLEVLDQVNLTEGETEADVYRRKLPECTHLVYAIGYEPNPLPRTRWDGEDVTDKLEFDMHTGGFHLTDTEKSSQSGTRNGHGERHEDGEESGMPKVPGLYGCGIAFPELAADPEGNVEAAVGLAKFFKFTERVAPDWVKGC